MVVITTTTITYSHYATGATMRRPSTRGGYVMGINARLRYGISWVIIKAVMPVFTWITSGLMLINVGVSLFALWFSPELQKQETIRLLKKMAEEASEDD
jgi:hypothetical protein